MRQPFVQVGVEAGVAWMTLDDPTRLNPVTPARIQEINDAATTLSGRDDVRVIVVTGAGRGFCSGADLTDEDMLSVETYLPAGRAFTNSLTGWSLASTRQPVVAMVNGAAVGFGAELALQADIRIAGTSARLGFPYAQIGSTTDTGAATWLLPRLVGHDRAAQLLFTGDLVDAAHALELGLVTQVVPDADLRATTEALCIRIAAGDPAAVQALKHMLVRARSQSAAEHILMQYEYMNSVKPDLAAFAASFGMQRQVADG
ncbi:enoyl-CoA hydratase/isomerase family protein [Rhodococcus sp. 2H158]